MLMNYIHAFWVGGLICALVQILLDKTRLMPGRVMVLLVCTGSVLSALHLYEPLVDYAGAGASVPLIGFGHLSGCERRDGTGGRSGSIYWRVKSQCRRYQCCADFRISCEFVFSSADEKIKKKETFSSCHIWKRYSIII